MPFKPPKRNVSDAENKLRLLYCVHALGQVAETQLWPFVASLELMEYIPMQLLLHELLSGGDLVMGAEAQKGLISLSAQGQESLRLFAHRVMPSDREQIDKAAPAYRAHLQKRRQIRTVYESARAGDYHVLLSLSEGELPTLRIRMQTPSKEYAMRSLQAFEACAAPLLAYLYGLSFMGEAEPNAFPGASPSTPVLVTHSPREHTVTAMLSTAAATFELTLLVPDLAAATELTRLFSMPGQQNAVAQRLFTLLCTQNEATKA